MPDLFPIRLLLATFAGWVNRHQAEVIDYLVEENRVLKEQLGGRRLQLTNDQRRRLATKGKAIGQKVLDQARSVPSLGHASVVPQDASEALFAPDLGS